MWTLCTLAVAVPANNSITYNYIHALKNVATFEYITSYTGSIYDGTIEGLTVNLTPYTDPIVFLPYADNNLLIQIGCAQGFCQLGKFESFDDWALTFQPNGTNNTYTQWIKQIVDSQDNGCSPIFKLISIISGKYLFASNSLIPTVINSSLLLF